MRKIRAISTLLLLLAVGCYDGNFAYPEPEDSPQPASTSIAFLVENFAGESYLVSHDLTLHGRVTTSDEGGNFYHSICIEENCAALEIRAGIELLHNDFPIGTLVTLHLKGFAIGKSRGVLQVGLPPLPGSGYAVADIASTPSLHQLMHRNSEQSSLIEPLRLTLAELRPSLCGCLVRVEGLTLVADEPATEEIFPTLWSGTNRFADAEGREIYTYVRDYARFAQEVIPTHAITITGILQQERSGRYSLKPRDEADILP